MNGFVFGSKICVSNRYQLNAKIKMWNLSKQTGLMVHSLKIGTCLLETVFKAYKKDKIRDFLKIFLFFNSSDQLVTVSINKWKTIAIVIHNHSSMALEYHQIHCIYINLKLLRKSSILLLYFEYNLNQDLNGTQQSPWKMFSFIMRLMQLILFYNINDGRFTKLIPSFTTLSAVST